MAMSLSPFFKLEILRRTEPSRPYWRHWPGRMPAKSAIMTAARSGTYRPLPGAAPAVGEVGQLFYGREVKIEVNCREEYLAAAIGAVPPTRNR